MYDDTNINPADVTDSATLADYEFLRANTVSAYGSARGAYSDSPLAVGLGLHHHGGDEVHVYSAADGKLAEVYPAHTDLLHPRANEIFTELTGKRLPATGFDGMGA